MSTEETVERRALEYRAEFVRDRLARTLSALDQRRKEMMDPKLQLRRHAPLAAAVGGGVLLLVGIAATVGAVKSRKQKRERSKERFRALSRWWNHPEEVAQYKPKSTLLGDIVRHVLTGVATMAATEMARRTMQGTAPPHALPADVH